MHIQINKKLLSFIFLHHKIKYNNIIQQQIFFIYKTNITYKVYAITQFCNLLIKFFYQILHVLLTENNRKIYISIYVYVYMYTRIYISIFIFL